MKEMVQNLKNFFKSITDEDKTANGWIYVDKGPSYGEVKTDTSDKILTRLLSALVVASGDQKLEVISKVHEGLQKASGLQAAELISRIIN